MIPFDSLKYLVSDNYVLYNYFASRYIKLNMLRYIADAYMLLEGDESIPFTPLQRKKLRRLYWLPWVKLQAFGLKFWNWPSVPKSQNFISRLTLEEQIYWLQVVNTI